MHELIWIKYLIDVASSQFRNNTPDQLEIRLVFEGCRMGISNY
jgi:hypothetical protein